MEELITLHATELLRLMRARAVSPVEVIEAHLRRIDELNPKLNAIVTLAPGALEQARRAEDAIMRGRSGGALNGLPVTIKDTIETKGLRTTAGAPPRAKYIPDADAPAVARLKAAGAILIGKTNVSEMAMFYESDNLVFGRTNNPFDTTRTPGGSSGGEASAISACLSPAGLGSDLVGSIRIPANFCGIVGLKPTTGRVPCAGHTPQTVGPLALGAAMGPLARSVADVSLLFNVIAGFEPTDSASRPANNWRAPKKIDVRGWNVAWYADDGVVPVTEQIRAAVETAARALEGAGLDVFEARPPGVERAPDLWTQLFSHAALKQVRETYDGQAESAGERLRDVLAKSAQRAPVSLDEFIGVWTLRDRLRAALVEWMKKFPLILAPVGAVPAFEHGARRVKVGDQSVSVFRAFGYSQAYNFFGLPSVAVPAGFSGEGLPLGVQIIGRPFEEAAVLAAASIVEESLGGWVRPSILTNAEQ